MKITTIFYALAGLSLLGVNTAAAVPKPVIKAEVGTKLPEIWQKVPASQKLLLVRAAEMDVYRRLAERLAGVHMTSDTTLRDFVAEDDELRAMFNHAIKSAEITSIVYNEDGTATVAATLKIGPLVRTIAKHKSAQGAVPKVEETVEQQGITETGNGAPAEDTPDAASAPTTKEVETVISSVLTVIPVID